MSTLLNKHVLLVGKKNPQLSLIEVELTSRGCKVLYLDCCDLSDSIIDEHAIELIVYHHSTTGKMCENIISLLSTKKVTKAVPVFSLVSENEDDIQLALRYGVADYITPTEDIESIVQKLKAPFSESEVFSGGANIDISPIEADLNSTGIRVFVVEDDPLLRNLLSIRMDKSGFPYEFSKDGQDVNTIIQQFKPDIVILDLMLPGKSGFEVLKDIKNDQATQHLPVLVFSNKDETSDREMAQELGAVDFHVKAMTDLSELMESIEKLVENSKNQYA